MKINAIVLLVTCVAALPASAIRVVEAHYGGFAFGYIGAGFDNTIQTDALGSEDTTSVKATATPNFVGPDVRYDIDFRVSLGLSYDLTNDKDIGENIPVELLFEIFNPSFNKLSRVEITGANLTKFELDESGGTEGYPSLRIKVEPVEPVLSASYQIPFTSRLGLSLYFDNTFDGADDDYQTVIVTNAAKDELADASHPSSALGVGVSRSFSGWEGQSTTFRYFVRSGLIDSYGVGYSFDDVQGSVNGFTYPSGFQFDHLGDPAGLGVSYDLNYAGESYRAYDLTYDDWKSGTDIQLGVNFAPRDSDSDGLPDDWEDANGFNKNDRNPANSDSDHDRQTEWQEYLQGTDPWSWASRLYVKQIDYNEMSGGLDLNWSSRDDKSYELHYLPAGSTEWMGVPGTGMIPGDAGSTSYSIPNVKSTLGDDARIRVALSLSF